MSIVSNEARTRFVSGKRDEDSYVSVVFWESDEDFYGVQG